MSKRRFASAVAASLALAACGTATNVTSLVASSPTKTVAQKTARLFEDIVITPATGSVQDITYQGVGDFAAHRTELTLSVAGQSGDLIVDGTTVYEKIPALASVLGKPWAKLDLTALGKLAGVSGLGNLVQGQSSDPTQGLQFLRGVTGAITTVGHEVVRGTRTTHYQATTDLERAASRLPADQQATVRQIIDKVGIHNAVVNVWIDGQGRIRRYHYAFDYSTAKPQTGLPGGALPKSLALTLELYDFGAPVSISVPPPDQTADLAQALAQLQPAQGTGTAAPSAAGPGNQLVGLLLDSLPAGYQQAADNVGQTGPSDLNKAVSDDGQPDARQALTADGFVAGYQRLWTSANNQIVDHLYQFTSPSGAAAYGQRQLASAASPSPGNQVTPFAVPSVPGAHGFTSTGTDGLADVVQFSKGPFLAQVVVHGPNASPQAATALAQEQYRRL
jgi:hypothetical protein